MKLKIAARLLGLLAFFALIILIVKWKTNLTIINIPSQCSLKIQWYPDERIKSVRYEFNNGTKYKLTSSGAAYNDRVVKVFDSSGDVVASDEIRPYNNRSTSPKPGGVFFSYKWSNSPPHKILIYQWAFEDGRLLLQEQLFYNNESIVNTKLYGPSMTEIKRDHPMHR